MTKVLNWYPLSNVGGGLNSEGVALNTLAPPVTDNLFIQVSEDTFLSMAGRIYTVWRRNGDGLLDVVSTSTLTPTTVGTFWGTNFAHGYVACMSAPPVSDFMTAQRVTVWQLDYTTGSATKTIDNVLHGVNWQNEVIAINGGTAGGTYTANIVPDPNGGAWLLVRFGEQTSPAGTMAWNPNALLMAAHMNSAGVVDATPVANGLYIKESDMTGRVPTSNGRNSTIIAPSGMVTFDDQVMLGSSANWTESPYYNAIGVARFGLSTGADWYSIDTDTGTNVSLQSAPRLDINTASGGSAAIPFTSAVYPIGTSTGLEPWAGIKSDGTVVQITDRISTFPYPNYAPASVYQNAYGTESTRFAFEQITQTPVTQQEWWHQNVPTYGDYTGDDAGVEEYVFFATSTTNWPDAGAALGTTLSSIEDFYVYYETFNPDPTLNEFVMRTHTYSGGVFEDGNPTILDLSAEQTSQEVGWLLDDQMVWVNENTALIYTDDPPTADWEGELPPDWAFSFTGSESNNNFLLLVEFDLVNPPEPPCEHGWLRPVMTDIETPGGYPNFASYEGASFSEDGNRIAWGHVSIIGNSWEPDYQILHNLSVADFPSGANLTTRAWPAHTIDDDNPMGTQTALVGDWVYYLHRDYVDSTWQKSEIWRWNPTTDVTEFWWESPTNNAAANFGGKLVYNHADDHFYWTHNVEWPGTGGQAAGALYKIRASDKNTTLLLGDDSLGGSVDGEHWIPGNLMVRDNGEVWAVGSLQYDQSAVFRFKPDGTRNIYFIPASLRDGSSGGTFLTATLSPEGLVCVFMSHIGNKYAIIVQADGTFHVLPPDERSVGTWSGSIYEVIGHLGYWWGHDQYLITGPDPDYNDAVYPVWSWDCVAWDYGCWNWQDIGELPGDGSEMGVVTSVPKAMIEWESAHADTWGEEYGILPLSNNTVLQGNDRALQDRLTWEYSFLQPYGNAGGDPQTFCLGPDGKIWGFSGTREIWEWNTDGTLYREYNGNVFNPNSYSDPNYGPGYYVTTFDSAMGGVFDTDGTLYVVGNDGIWKTDPSVMTTDPAGVGVLDEWPDRTSESNPFWHTWPGDYQFKCTKIVSNQTPYNSGDGPHDTNVWYQGSCFIHSGRLYWLAWHNDTDEGRIYSVALNGTDLQEEYVANATDQTDDANGFINSIAFIYGDLYMVGTNWAGAETEAIVWRFPSSGNSFDFGAIEELHRFVAYEESHAENYDYGGYAVPYKGGLLVSTSNGFVEFTPKKASGTYAVLMNTEWGWPEVIDEFPYMRLVDLSDPTNPQVVSDVKMRQIIDAAREWREWYDYHTNGDVEDMYHQYTWYDGVWHGSLFYAMPNDGSWSENFIIDFSNPEQPVVVGTHITGDDPDRPNDPQPFGFYGIGTGSGKVTIANGHLYIGGASAHYRTGGMQIGAEVIAKYDISGPEGILHPIYVDHIHWPGRQGYFRSLIVDGNVMYAVESGGHGWPGNQVHSIDITTMTLLDTFQVSNSNSVLGEGVLVEGKLHVQCDDNDPAGEMVVINVSDPSNMTFYRRYGGGGWGQMDTVGDFVLTGHSTADSYSNTLFDPADDSIESGPWDSWTTPVPGRPEGEWGLQNANIRSLGDDKHVYSQFGGYSGPPEYEDIWGQVVLDATNDFSVVGANITSFGDYSGTALEYPSNIHITTIPERIVFSAETGGSPYIHAAVYPTLESLDTRTTDYDGSSAPAHTYNVHWDYGDSPPADCAYDILGDNIELRSQFYFSVGNPGTIAYDIHFSADGTKVVIAGDRTNSSGQFITGGITAYTLSTPWDVTTMSLASSLDTYTNEHAARGVSMSPDGTVMMISFGGVVGIQRRLERWTLSTAWDVSTATFSSIYNYPGFPEESMGLFFVPDGLTFFTLINYDNLYFVKKYTVSSAWTLSGVTQVGSDIQLTESDSFLTDLYFTSDGTRMFTVATNTIHRYDLSTAWDPTSRSYYGEWTPQYVDNSYTAIAFSPNGKTAYATAASQYLSQILEFDLCFVPVPPRELFGMTLLPDGRLATLVRNSGYPEGGEIVTFDTASLYSPPVVEAFWDDEAIDPVTGLDYAGTMEGHIGYNHVDNRIYVADNYGAIFDPGHFPNGSGHGTRLVAIDIETWERTHVVEFPSATTYEYIVGGMTIAPDGGVWYITGVNGSGDAYFLHCYRPQSDTDLSFEIPTPSSMGYYGLDPFALADSTVLLYTDEDNWRTVYRYRADPERITREHYYVADLDENNGPWWAGTYTSLDDPTEGWVWDWSNLWTYDQLCTGLVIGYMLL